MSEIGEKSKEIARGKLLDLCKKAKLTPDRTMQRISEGLDAVEKKATYDKDRGKWVYSTDLIDWAARAKAVDQAIAILDLKPAEKHDVRVRSLEDVLRELDDDDAQR